MLVISLVSLPMLHGAVTAGEVVRHKDSSSVLSSLLPKIWSDVSAFFFGVEEELDDELDDELLIPFQVNEWGGQNRKLLDLMNGGGIGGMGGGIGGGTGGTPNLGGIGGGIG